MLTGVFVKNAFFRSIELIIFDNFLIHDEKSKELFKTFFVCDQFNFSLLLITTLILEAPKISVINEFFLELFIAAKLKPGRKAFLNFLEE